MFPIKVWKCSYVFIAEPALLEPNCPELSGLLNLIRAPSLIISSCSSFIRLDRYINSGIIEYYIFLLKMVCFPSKKIHLALFASLAWENLAGHLYTNSWLNTPSIKLPSCLSCQRRAVPSQLITLIFEQICNIDF